MNNNSRVIPILTGDIISKAIPALAKAPFTWKYLGAGCIQNGTDMASYAFPCENGRTYLVLVTVLNENYETIHEEIDLFYKPHGRLITTLFGAAQLARPVEKTMEVNVSRNATMAEIKKAVQRALSTQPQDIQADAPWDDIPDGSMEIIKSWRIEGIWK